MKNFRSIWRHEIAQADQIARRITEIKQPQINWTIFVFPIWVRDYIRFKKSISLTRKNLLFTKRLAFNAAKEVFGGEDRSLEFRRIEIQTKNLLDKEKKGFYTEKIRRKQFVEIELLMDHFLKLFHSNRKDYSEMVKAAYGSKKAYQSFLDNLQESEEKVIHASVSEIRKGSKKDRTRWFEKVKTASKELKRSLANDIFSA
jgi:hypothetical protein